MAFPPPNATFGDDGSDTLFTAQTEWVAVANTIGRYEPVTLLSSADQIEVATNLVGPGVSVLEQPLDDAWMRDSGPTFTLDNSRLRAIDWVFNGWGAQHWASWENDALVAADVAHHVGAEIAHSTLTNEGGGIHVDGAGTVLLTETVQLDPSRNPGWTRAQVEVEIHAQLGTTHAIWLPRGFVRPGLVVAHSQLDPAHPDYEVTKELIALLRSSKDASGRTLEVVEIVAPTILADDGTWTDYSYINHYVGNGFVIVGTFDDPNDDQALDLLAHLYPGRRVERARGRVLFAHGGGVHCITQQQPFVERRPGT
jgi:agmatine deiminase